MRTSAARSTAFGLAAFGLAVVFVATPASLTAAPDWPDADDPVDLVLLVDVSTSMFAFGDPTDPDGIRWDGIQFLIDTASPSDRIALVVYRGDAALVTRYLDPSGFVTLGSGDNSPRHALKKIVTGFQQFERDHFRKPEEGARDSYPIRIDGRPDEFLTLERGGTGSLPALKAVLSEWQLQFPKPGHRPWVMLFTDGLDERPEPSRDSDNVTDRLIKWGKGRFKYIESREKEWTSDKPETPLSPSSAVLEDLRAEVELTVAPFRERKIPVFTFGMVTDTMPKYARAVMDDTLSLLSKQSLAKLDANNRFASIEAFRTASNNLDLLGQLRNLGWELRERWHTGKALPRPPYRFSTPDRELCNDLGMLLYQEVPGRRSMIARSPVPGKTVVGKTVADAEKPLESPSHHYVRFPAGNGPADVSTEFPPGEGTAHAIISMKLKAPYVRLVPPDRTYSPIDAIPVVVEFDPRGRTDITRADFVVTADVLDPMGQKRQLTLVPSSPPTTLGRWEFHAELVPDADRKPDSPATPGLEGDWRVEVQVTAAEQSPLRGATRRLLPTLYRVGPYPKVVSPGTGVEVTNLGRDAGRATASFALEGKHVSSKDRNLVSLAAELVPANPGDWKGLVPPRLPRVTVRDGKADIVLNLTGFDWSAVPRGGLKGKLRLAAPWPDAAAECAVTITKKPYPLKVGGALLFDLSGEKAEDKVSVSLDTSLSTTESVLVSGDASKATNELNVEDKAKNVKLTLKIGSAGKTEVSGRSGDVLVAIERAKGTAVPAGEYTGTIHLIPADGWTEPVSVALRVLVNQPILKVRGVPSPRVQLALLAGTKDFKLPLEVSMEGPATTPSITAATPKPVAPLRLLGSEDPADIISIPAGALRPGNRPGRFTLAVGVPQSVRDGRYTTELVFEAKTAPGVGGAAGVAFTVRRAVEVEVRRFAVEADTDEADTDSPLDSPGPTDFRRLREKHPDFPGHDAALRVALVTNFTDNDTTVRWWAKLVEAAPPPAGTKPTPLDHWFEGRIDVLELTDTGPGQTVLGQDARPIPVSKASEQKLVVVAHKLETLPPGAYRCKVRFYGTVDPHRKGAKVEAPADPDAEPPHYDVPIEVLVRGRTFAAERAGEGAIQVTVTTFGCSPGTGQIRSLDVPGPQVPVTTEVRAVPDGRPLAFPPVTVTPGPGLSRFVVEWPWRANQAGPPATPEDALRREVRFWQKPKMTADRTVTAPGDKVTFRVPLTPVTFEALKRPLVGKLLRRGASDGLSIPFNEDAANRELTAVVTMPSDPTAGIYDFKLTDPLVIESKLDGPIDAKDLMLDSVAVQVGLEVQKIELPLSPLIYGGGLLTSDSINEPGVTRLTNNTDRDIRYTVQVLYPKTVPDSRTISTQVLSTLPLGAFDPSLHLDFKPTTTEGTIKPGATAEIGVTVSLSGDALEAYQYDREHRTLRAKNGAVLVVKVEGLTLEGQKYEWELRHPMVVETQPWRSRGLWYGLVVAMVLPAGVYFGYRKWRSWAARRPKPPEDGSFPEPSSGELAAGSPRGPTPPNDDYAPPPENVFGGPPI